MKLKPLYEVASKVVRVSDFGATSDGPRADVYLEGEARGRVKGRFRGVDYGVYRTYRGSKGVVVHVHETIETKGGLVSVMRRGYALPKDDRFRVTCSCTFQTAVPSLKFLNTTVGFAEGYADGKGVALKVYEISSE